MCSVTLRGTITDIGLAVLSATGAQSPQGIGSEDGFEEPMHLPFRETTKSINRDQQSSAPAAIPPAMIVQPCQLLTNVDQAIAKLGAAVGALGLLAVDAAGGELDADNSDAKVIVCCANAARSRARLSV